MHNDDAVLLQALQQLAKTPTVAAELQPGAAHSFDRGFEAVYPVLASQQEDHMPARTAAIIRTVRGRWRAQSSEIRGKAVRAQISEPMRCSSS